MHTSTQGGAPMITPVADTSIELASARTWARIGVLAALAVVVGWAETFIPLPLPIAGVKLGLANIVVLVVLVLMGPRPAAVVALVKVLSTGILFGNPLMMLFSAAGTVLAYLVMLLLVRIPGLHIAVASVAAAMAHNIGQLAVAQVVLGTPMVWYSAPFMLLAACATGALCGFAAKWTLEALGDMFALQLAGSPAGVDSAQQANSLQTTHSALESNSPQATHSTLESSNLSTTHSAQQANKPPTRITSQATTAQKKRTTLPPSTTSSKQRESQLARAFQSLDIRVKALVLVAYFILAFHASTPDLLVTVALIAIAAAFITQVRIGEVARVLAPLAFIIVITVIMQLAYWQEGNVLAQLGPLAITDEGVWRAIRMVVAQASVVLASVAFMNLVDTSELVRAFAWLLKPLENLGINTRGITLSLTVAIAFIPVLVREFINMRAAHEARGVSFDGTLRERLQSYTRLFAPLVRSSFRHADSLAESILSRGY